MGPTIEQRKVVMKAVPTTLALPPNPYSGQESRQVTPGDSRNQPITDSHFRAFTPVHKNANGQYVEKYDANYVRENLREILKDVIHLAASRDPDHYNANSNRTPDALAYIRFLEKNGISVGIVEVKNTDSNSTKAVSTEYHLVLYDKNTRRPVELNGQEFSYKLGVERKWIQTNKNGVYETSVVSIDSQENTKLGKALKSYTEGLFNQGKVAEVSAKDQIDQQVKLHTRQWIVENNQAATRVPNATYSPPDVQNRQQAQNNPSQGGNDYLNTVQRTEYNSFISNSFNSSWKVYTTLYQAAGLKGEPAAVSAPQMFDSLIANLGPVNGAKAARELAFSMLHSARCALLNDPEYVKYQGKDRPSRDQAVEMVTAATKLLQYSITEQIKTANSSSYGMNQIVAATQQASQMYPVQLEYLLANPDPRWSPAVEMIKSYKNLTLGIQVLKELYKKQSNKDASPLPTAIQESERFKDSMFVGFNGLDNYLNSIAQRRTAHDGR